MREEGRVRDSAPIVPTCLMLVEVFGFLGQFFGIVSRIAGGILLCLDDVLLQIRLQAGKVFLLPDWVVLVALKDLGPLLWAADRDPGCPFL